MNLKGKVTRPIIPILLFLILAVSCKKDKPAPVLLSDKELTSFVFKATKNPGLLNDVTGEIKGDTVYLAAFAGTDLSRLVPEFTYEGVKVAVNEQEQTNGVTANDFTGLVDYSVVAEDNSAKVYTVKFTDNGISALYLNTGNVSIDSKETYVPGSIKIVGNFRDILYDGQMEIKGRGNSTWGMPKKPYRIKLNKKASILGMLEGRNWVLLANYADKTLMRNELAFITSRNSGLAFTPDSRYVDVFLNGSYQGNYLLTEQIKEGKDLVDVEYDGGYLLEVDGFASSEPVHFYTNKGMPVTVKYPDEKISPQQKQYITNHFQNFENALFSADFADPVTGYRKYFDVNSFVNYYIVNEVMGNPDVFWSTYMYKKPGDDKIYTGPVWDFDIAVNNDDRLGDQVNGLMFNAAHEPKVWINRLMEDATFRSKIRSRWNELKPKISTLPASVDVLSKKLSLSQNRNFIKWNILNTKVYREVQIGGSYNAEVAYLKAYLMNHINWLDTKFNSAEYQ
jgi:hypothetical protein